MVVLVAAVVDPVPQEEKLEELALQVKVLMEGLVVMQTALEELEAAVVALVQEEMKNEGKLVVMVVLVE